MGNSRFGPLAAIVVMLLVTSALGPSMSVSAAPTLPPDDVKKGTLSVLNDRDDWNFTAQPDQWTVVAANCYSGEGAFRHGLRTNITSKNPIVETNVGNVYKTRAAGAIVINGYQLSSPTPYTVTEELGLYSPSYALHLLTDMTTLSRDPKTVSGNLIDDGVAVGFELMLLEQETLDLRLRVPPEWTYNYHFSLLLFSPTGKYHQFEGQGGVQPVAVSDAGKDSEQALTWVVRDPGVHLIVLLNEGAPDKVRYDLEMAIDGLPLGAGETDDETLTSVNEEDYYSVIAPSTSWSAAVVKARDTLRRPITHSLHWPTPDSKEIAYDIVSDASPAGIIALNGHALSSSDTYYVRERNDPDGETAPFTVQFARAMVTIPPTNGTTSGSLTSDDIFMVYETNLQASQTADLRLQVGDDYNYDHDLGLYVFPPGEKYYSISGERAELAGGPVAMSRAGLNTEQDVVFTCPETGIYAIVVVNFALRDDIPFTLETTIQGRGLAHDTPLAGDLNAQNQEDLFQFQAQWDEWNVVGCRVLSDDGALYHRLHSTALDTNPIREERVGHVPKKGGRHGETEDMRLGLMAVDGHQLPSDTTYFVREEVMDGEPEYLVELDDSPRSLVAPSDNLSASFRSDEFLHAYSVDLATHDTIDLEAAPPEDYTYDYELGVYVLPPGELYRNLGTEGDVVAMARPGVSRDPSLVFTATAPGEHLVVVANLGRMTDLDYVLTYAVNGFDTRTFQLNTGVLDADNAEDAFRFDAYSGAYALVVVRLPGEAPVAELTATLRWPTIDSVALSTLVLDGDERVGAFVIDGSQLPLGTSRHFVHVTADVPEGRTLPYQIQIDSSSGGLPFGVMNLTDQEVGVLYSPPLVKGQTVDLALRVPPDYTYSFDLGLYVFAPDEPYMSTTDPEAGPRAMSRYGPGTEQEVVYTSTSTADYAVVALNHAGLVALSYNLSATVDGRPLDAPARGYVDAYNRNEQYNFTVPANQWSVLAGAYVGGGGAFDLKLLTNGLSTNPVDMRTLDGDDGTGVIAINGWEFDEAAKSMFANISHALGRTDFVVHAATMATDFGPVGHSEVGEFGADEIAYIFLIDLVASDYLDLSVDYDQGNWSADVVLDLEIFEPGQALGASPVRTVSLEVREGRREDKGTGTFLADKTGTYGFVLVNRGPLGPMGFTLGVFRHSAVNQPPMYPAILRAESSTDSITVHWAPNQEPDFQKYEIFLSTSQGDKGDRIDTISTQTMSKYTITRLDPGHRYYITLVVYDEEGLSTSSIPKVVNTDELPLYAEPMLWVIILTIVIAVVAIVGIDWFIKRQKAGAAVASARRTEAGEGPPEAELEVEELEGARAPARPSPEKAEAGEREDAIAFMRDMMGDGE